MASSTSCKSCARLDASGHAKIKITKPSHEELKKLIDILLMHRLMKNMELKDRLYMNGLKDTKHKQFLQMKNK